MKKITLLAAALGALAFGANSAGASDPIFVPVVNGEGCVAVNGDSCSYTSTRSGGFVARGTWTLTVDDDADGLVDRTFTSSDASQAQQGCGLWDPGAIVTVTASASSGIAAGNPFPVQSDPVLGDSNDCA